MLKSAASKAASLRQLPLPATFSPSRRRRRRRDHRRTHSNNCRGHTNQSQQGNDFDENNNVDDYYNDAENYDWSDENADHHDDAEEDIGGWDHSILNESQDDLPSHSNNSASSSSPPAGRGGEERASVQGSRSCLSYHAMACGNVILGRSSNWSNNKNDSYIDNSLNEHEEMMEENSSGPNDNDINNNCSRNSWWQTSINSHIHTLATNTTGSVIAVATSNEVSLLKGFDGSVLATRQICSSSSITSHGNSSRSRSGRRAPSSFPPPQLLFLSRYNDSTTVTTSSTGNEIPNEYNDGTTSSQAEETDAMDALVVLCPMDTVSNSPPTTSRQQQQSPRPPTPISNIVILINHISGTLLNSPDIEQVTTGAKLMNISALKLLDRGVNVVITGIQGAFVHRDTIRFFVEYHTTTTTTTTTTIDPRRSGSDIPSNNSNNTIMSVVDYNTIEKKTRVVLQDLGRHYWINDEMRRWGLAGSTNASTTTSFVEMEGMGMDSYRPILSGNFLLVIMTACTTAPITSTATSTASPPMKAASTLLWINILDLSVAAKFTLPSNVSLLSCTPLRSYDSTSCVAAAVAYRRRSNSMDDGSSNDSAIKAEIAVVQALLLTTKDDDEEVSTAATTLNDIVPDAMILFTLDVEAPNNAECSSVNLCSVPSSIVGRRSSNSSNQDDEEGAYVFRYLCKSKSGEGNAMTKLWEFVPNKHSQLGLLHTLLVRHDFDRARSLLDQLSDFTECLNGSRISTPITKSFISLMQLQYILSKPLSKEDNVLEARECLKRISKSVILSGGDATEVKCMCDAARFVLSWPKNQVRSVDVGTEESGDYGHVTMVYIREVCMALTTMSSVISSVVNVVGPSKSALLEDHRRKLGERGNTLKTLLSIVPSLDATKVTLKEFQKISRLQSGCEIFLTIDELRNPSCCVRVVSDLLQPCVDLLLSRKILLETEDDSLRDELRPLVANAKQWCAILCDTSSKTSHVWSCAVGYTASKVAKISTNHVSLLLLEVSGLLDELDGHSSFHTITSVALTLCARAFSEASHLLRPSYLSKCNRFVTICNP